MYVTKSPQTTEDFYKGHILVLWEAYLKTMCFPRVNVKIFMKRKSTATSHQNDKSVKL